jgi:putative tryptophan/tyrosine transport system substrate-binding protein
VVNNLNRRDAIAVGGTAMLWPLVGRAQQSTLPVIGFLSGRSLAVSKKIAFLFEQGLNEVGYVESHNVKIEYRWATFDNDRLSVLSGLAAELVGRRVAVMVTSGTPAALAAKRTTTTIPIVFVAGVDPIAAGLAASLSRPGGNITGISFLANTIAGLKLQLIHEAVPTAIEIGLLVNPTNEFVAESNTLDVQKAADALGLRLHVVKASRDSDLAPAFSFLVQQQVGALIVVADDFLNSQVDQLVEFAARYALPTIYPLRDFADAGGLMSYGATIADAFRQAASYVARILHGASPGELPVMQSTMVELVINLKTAKALGLTLPLPLLGRADEVIE